jgi:hypothetical protein
VAAAVEWLLPWGVRLVRGAHFARGLAPEVCRCVDALAAAGTLYRFGARALVPLRPDRAPPAIAGRRALGEREGGARGRGRLDGVGPGGAPASVEVYRIVGPCPGRDGLVRHYHLPGDGRPLLVLNYGTGAHARIERAFVGPLLAAGLDVALPSAARIEGGRAVPRSLAFTGSVGGAIAAIVALVHHNAAVAAWARARGYGIVAGAGLGIGGVVAALLAAMSPRLDACVTMLTGGHPGWLWRPPRALARVLDRRALARDGIARPAALAAPFDPVAPLCMAPPAPRVRRAVVGFRFDTIAPPRDVARLAAHWGVAPLWLARAHVELAAAAVDLVPIIARTATAGVR